MQEELSSEEVERIVNRPDRFGIPLTHYLVSLDLFEILEFLVKCKADLNKKTLNEKISPLMIASAQGHISSFKELVRLGARYYQR